jgi:L,D-peptidoglycan transpeptidase YkuD (ErfK/YbiS/YcfS/YnhG family)
VLGLVVVLVAAGLVGPVAPASAAHRIRLGGVPVDLPAGSRQVVTVNHAGGYHARVTLWRRAPGGWRRVVRAHDGRIGYGGLVAADQRKQGTGTTPLGTFRLISSFGRHPRHAAWHMPYRRIRSGDYWVEDNESAYYNRYRNKAQGGFRWWLAASNVNSSERLTDYPRQYEYSVVTSFNRRQVRYRGAGIFLHVNGSGATAGCVSAPRRFLRRTMRALRPVLHPVIAVGQ